MMQAIKTKDHGLDGPVLDATHDVYAIVDDNELILHVGIAYMAMLSGSVFLWIKPTPRLRALHLRKLKKMYKEQRWNRVVASIDKDDARAVRFAEAFGFRRLAAYSTTHDLYGDM